MNIVSQVHAYIISSLRKDMPSVFGKEGKKKELIKNLDALYTQLQREHQISPGDFPDIKKMQEQLANQDFTKFHHMDKKLLERVDKMLAEDIAKMMSMIPLDEEYRRQKDEDKIKGGAFDGVMETATPFMFKGGEGINAGVGEVEWVVNKDRSVSSRQAHLLELLVDFRYKYDNIFDGLGAIDGKVSGASAKSKKNFFGK